MILLLDIGNSRVKWAHYCQSKLSPVYSIKFDDVDEIWRTLNSSFLQLGLADPETIAISCVKPSLSTQLRSIASPWPDAKIIAPQSETCFAKLQCAYENPSRLGVDRWLAMIAASNAGENACIAVDCGTALTIDLVDTMGVHCGGYINAGLTTQLSALLAGTEKVFSKPLAEVENLHPGKDTEDCVVHGLIRQTVSYIKDVCMEFNHQYSAPLVLTGGDSETLFPFINKALSDYSITIEIRPALVFEGLLAYVLKDLKKM